jgi:hypothetical protein
VKTVQPRSPRMRLTFFQHHPPWNPPCTSTAVEAISSLLTQTKFVIAKSDPRPQIDCNSDDVRIGYVVFLSRPGSPARQSQNIAAGGELRGDHLRPRHGGMSLANRDQGASARNGYQPKGR